ncbi:MAG: class I SAM-dependent DNA methyltransferase [Bacillota bacterium]
MNAYSGFAYVYDLLMKDVDYERWVDYIEEIFHRYDFKPCNIAELACGTGNITNELAKRGYNLLGIDISEDMLSVAQQKAMDIGVYVIYMNQDMRRLEIPHDLDAILCICDGINYITDDRDLLKLFQSVHMHLKNKGLFLFDISTYYKLSRILGKNTFAENHKDVSYIWENYFDEKRNICDFDLTIFMKEGKLYRKYEESHSQRAYQETEILSLLERTGFRQVQMHDEFSFDKPKENSERIHFVCQK